MALTFNHCLHSRLCPAVSSRFVVRATEDNKEPNKTPPPGTPSFGLDEFVDPVKLGRKSRQAFDELWTQFATLASPTKSYSESDFYQDSGFAVDPEAQNTKVLVIGGFGRTGKIVVRKLLLRGYKVRVLVRSSAISQEMMPDNVEVVVGDITNNEVCEQAVYGVQKVVFAASSKQEDPEEYKNIFEVGLKNLLRAFMDYKWMKSAVGRRGGKRVLAFFKNEDSVYRWTAKQVGRYRRSEGDIEEKVLEFSDVEGVRQWTTGQNSFVIRQSKNRKLHFRGSVNDIGSSALVGGSVEKEKLAKAEGVILRIRGDGHVYSLVCTRDDGQRFAARFLTKWGYNTVRIPFTLFRPDFGGSEDLDASRIVEIGLRFENTGKPVATYPGERSEEQPVGRFNVELDWVKTLPAADSTEFVMISCAGVPRKGVKLDDLQQILTSKRIGESMLRNSGVSYTIVRPTTLIDEPGGLRSLVFDQGDRITESISAVDVADVCVRSLPQPLAGNKTFEVGHESPPSEEEKEAYELVAHVPDKSTNYLGAALANLQKNT